MTDQAEYIRKLTDRKLQAELSWQAFQEGVKNVDADDFERLLRVVPYYLRSKYYREYYQAHKDVLPQLEQAWLAEDYQKYFYLHSEDWWFYALRAVWLRTFPPNLSGSLRDVSEDKCAVFDALLADTRAADLRNHANEPTDDPWLDAYNSNEWSEILEYFNVHGLHRYMTEEEWAEWLALPEKLVLYIGWERDNAASAAQFWTLDYEHAEENASIKSNGDVFMTVFPKHLIKGYLNRHGRKEIILAEEDVDFDALEPYTGKPTDTKPLES